MAIYTISVSLELIIESQTPYLSAAIFIFLSFTGGLAFVGMCQYIAIQVEGNENKGTPGDQVSVIRRPN